MFTLYHGLVNHGPVASLYYYMTVLLLTRWLTLTYLYHRHCQVIVHYLYFSKTRSM